MRTSIIKYDYVTIPLISCTDEVFGRHRAEEWDARIRFVKDDAARRILERERPWTLEPRFVPFTATDSLGSAYKRTRALKDKEGKVLIDMPSMCPYSIRNKMVTVMRAANVPGSQRSMWMGHMDEEEREVTARSYGAWEPDFLQAAAEATDAFLVELNKRTDRDLFATSHCKSIANQNVVAFKRPAEK